MALGKLPIVLAVGAGVILLGQGPIALAVGAGVILLGQGPIALAVGAGGGCLDIFTLLYLFSPLSSTLWETTRYRQILSQRAVKTQNNQPTKSTEQFHC